METAKDLLLFARWFGGGFAIYMLILNSPRTLHSPWLWLALGLMALGGAANFIAITSNGGRMPVREVPNLHFVASDRHTLLDAETKFPYLCDTYRFKVCGGRRITMFSLGDVLTGVGCAGIVVLALLAAPDMPFLRALLAAFHS